MKIWIIITLAVILTSVLSLFVISANLESNDTNLTESNVTNITNITITNITANITVLNETDTNLTNTTFEEPLICSKAISTSIETFYNNTTNQTQNYTISVEANLCHNRTIIYCNQSDENTTIKLFKTNLNEYISDCSNYGCNGENISNPAEPAPGMYTCWVYKGNNSKDFIWASTSVIYDSNLEIIRDNIYNIFLNPFNYTLFQDRLLTIEELLKNINLSNISFANLTGNINNYYNVTNITNTTVYNTTVYNVSNYDNHNYIYNITNVTNITEIIYNVTNITNVNITNVNITDILYNITNITNITHYNITNITEIVYNITNVTNITEVYNIVENITNITEIHNNITEINNYLGIVNQYGQG